MAKTNLPQTIKLHEHITQELLDAIGEPVESVVSFSNISGLSFVTVSGGKIAVYNKSLNKALLRRWDNIDACIEFLKSKRIIEPEAK